MKSKIILSILTVLLVLTSACVTQKTIEQGPDGVITTNTTHVVDVARVARLTGVAANLGTQAWLEKHPDDRSYFILAEQTLRGLMDTQNYDPSAFAGALRNLPVRELKGGEGRLIVTAATVLFEEAISLATPLQQKELVRECIIKVASGLSDGLAATQQSTSE